MNNFELKFKDITGINFQSFFNEQKPKLVWYLTRWTRDQELAEDFANEAFIQALEKLDTYKPDKAKIETWLYTIAKNITTKNYNDEQKMKKVSMDKEHNNNSTINMFLPAEDSNVSTQKMLEDMKKAEIVKSAIYNMTEKQYKYKRVLIMREIDNMSYNEIAEYLELNLSTVKSQIKKGRDIISKKVQKKLDFIDNNGLIDNL